jgi:hypothetical protein
MEKLPNSGQPSEQFDERFKLQAKERNNNRPLHEKLFQQNKSSAIDIAREEADRVNDLVDKGDGESFQDTADEIIGGKEFGSDAGTEADQKRIKFQELIRSKYPELEKSIEHGFINPGYLQGIKETMTESEEEDFIEGLRDMISDKIDSTIRANDLVTMEILLTSDYRDLQLLSATDVARMPIELLSKPHLKPKAMGILQTYLKQTLYPEAQVREILEKLESKST